MVELQQQFALAHGLADIDQQFGHAQAVEFDAELHLLPCRHRPGHQHAARDVAGLHARHADRERGDRFGGIFFLLAAGGGEQGDANGETEEQRAGDAAHARSGDEGDGAQSSVQLNRSVL